MGQFCKVYCLLINLVGACYLFGFGLVLSSGYEYSKIDDKESGALNCFIASGIYCVYPVIFIILYIRYRCRPKYNSPEDIPLIEMKKDSS
ncbi:hypothetical protein SteCoe_13627 [Stentor coeruleus]|uniref:Uncharacterized protein n=1 Tax=Stentor coeruleus TaxID=5963 RepID=A0A1R2C7V9_9CILI|nr:hypothetical protein SteCoe_13627 [Stentor coeruleus]